jgi:hypothetical protein
VAGRDVDLDARRRGDACDQVTPPSYDSSITMVATNVPATSTPMGLSAPFTSRGTPVPVPVKPAPLWMVA